MRRSYENRRATRFLGVTFGAMWRRNVIVIWRIYLVAGAGVNTKAFIASAFHAR